MGQREYSKVAKCYQSLFRDVSENNFVTPKKGRPFRKAPLRGCFSAILMQA